MNGYENELMKYVATQGPWAAVFVGLLYYVMREGARREAQLMTFLQAQGEALTKLAERVDHMCGDIGEIRKAVEELR